MDDYISRQAAIDACYDGYADCRDDCASNIQNLPPADVRPVVRGRWINIEQVGLGSFEAECSNCGHKSIYKNSWNCCPYCLADMRTDEEQGGTEE